MKKHETIVLWFDEKKTRRAPDATRFSEANKRAVDSIEGGGGPTDEGCLRCSITRSAQ